MTVFIVLLLWNVGRSTAATDQPSYHIPVQTVDIDENEPRSDMNVPPVYTGWTIQKPGAKFMAHLFAGKAEYPFVVWIKATEYAPCQDPADAIYREAMGILITADVVMTACRPVSYLCCDEQNISKYEEWPTDDDPLPNPITVVRTIPIFPGSDRIDRKTLQCPSEKLRITPLAPHILNVRYASVYLYEDNKYANEYGHYIKDERELFCGMRHIYDLILHPNCRPWQTLEKDIALLFMTASIFPAGNWVGFPTFPLNAQGQIDRTDLSNNDRVCHIAGFNNDYAGMLGDDQITRHYKVKFRTYQQHIKICESYMKIICFDRQVPLLKGCWLWLTRYERMNEAQKKAAGIECWETRHKIGAVCNIHTGAPLVCGGVTHGFVLRGADWERCNNMYRMPFFVTRLHPFEDFFSLLTLQRVFPYNPILTSPENHNPPSQPTRSRSSRQSKNGLQPLMWAFLYTARTFKF